MLKIGAHLSAGKSILNAGKAAVEMGVNVVQLFLAPPYRLQLIGIDEEEAKEYCQQHNSLTTVVHGPYVLNLVSRSKIPEKYCVKYMLSLLGGAEKIGAKYIVMHVGSNEDKLAGRLYIKHILGLLLHLTEGCEVVICLETDAGGGNRMGDLRQLRSVVKAINSPRVKMCVDTAHMYANGVAVHKERGIEQLTKYLDLIDVVHINEPEPKVVFKGHLDRHNNIYGTGPIGVDNLRGIAELFKDKVLIVECRDKVATKENVNMLKEWLCG